MKYDHYIRKCTETEEDGLSIHVCMPKRFFLFKVRMRQGHTDGVIGKIKPRLATQTSPPRVRNSRNARVCLGYLTSSVYLQFCLPFNSAR